MPLMGNGKQRLHGKEHLLRVLTKAVEDAWPTDLAKPPDPKKIAFHAHVAVWLNGYRRVKL